MNKVKLWAISFAFILVGVFSALLFTSPAETWAQGGVTGFSSLRVTNFYRMQPRAVITLTMNGDLDPTGSYTRIAAAGAVSISGDDVTVEPAGTILTLVNIGSNTITITETANIKSAGNIALGALDTATLVSDGSDWYQIAASNN